MTEQISITKMNAKQHTLRGFITAVAIHLLLLGGYYIATALASEQKAAPKLRRPPSFADFIQPPSIEEESVEPVVAPDMSVDVTKPVFGIPVPVPDIIGLDKILPDLKTELTTQHVGDSVTGIIGKQAIGSILPASEIHKEAVKKPIPDPTEFIEFNEDPVPVQSIQQLVVYPEVARLSHIEGKVIASVYIGTDGRAEKVIIEKSDNEIFNRSAEEALLKARFTPARQDKTPVAVWWTVPISYKLTR